MWVVAESASPYTRRAISFFLASFKNSNPSTCGLARFSIFIFRDSSKSSFS